MDDDANTFTFDEVRFALTAFAMWLALWRSSDEMDDVALVELVDRFLDQTMTGAELKGRGNRDETRQGN